MTRSASVNTGARDSDSAPSHARREPSQSRSEARRVRLARSSSAAALSSQAAPGYLLEEGARHLPQTLSHSRLPEIRRTVLMAHSNDDYLVNSMLVDHAIRKAVQEAPPRARRQSLPRERELAYPAQRSFHLFLKPGTETWQLTLVELRGVKQISPCRSKDADSHFFLRRSRNSANTASASTASIAPRS